MQVLVLDGNENQAVASVRSLARAGHRVLVGSSASWSKAGWARGAAGTFRYPAPQADAVGFVRRVAEEAAREPGTLVLPMTERTTLPLSERRAQIFEAGGRLVLPPAETVRRAFDKSETTRLASSLGVAVPHTELVADDEGYVERWLPVAQPFPAAGWQPVTLELIEQAATAPAASKAEILIPAASAAFGVISDLDDTVIQSEVLRLARAARLVLLENARTRLPFPGVAAFYRALEAGAGTAPAGNPIFYVSNSPWNLYGVIADFLEAQQVPAGPILLTDWDWGRPHRGGRTHKESTIAGVLDAYPNLPFLLVGDSGQTLFAEFKQHRLALPAPGGTSSE